MTRSTHSSLEAFLYDVIRGFPHLAMYNIHTADYEEYVIVSKMTVGVSSDWNVLRNIGVLQLDQLPLGRSFH